jgi:hypothetical protein
MHRQTNDLKMQPGRRAFLKSAGIAAAGLCLTSIALATAQGNDAYRVATFRCDVTPPLGQPMFSCDPLKKVEQPLLAKGCVIEADGRRYVLCAIDWCELCSGGYDAMRSKIAAAAGTEVSNVALQTLHQHTAPLVDLSSQKLLAEIGVAKGIHIDLEVFNEINGRLANAVKESIAKFEPFDRIGTSQAKVDRVASSRRPVDAKGVIQPRMSSTSDPALQALPEGKIDPYLKTITLARGEKPLVRLHYYATHPQSKYGDGRGSSDFVGKAREALEKQEGVFQVYFTGCGGDITVGKYNTGSEEDRAELAKRLLAGMEASAVATKLAPVGPMKWRTYPLPLPARTDAGFNRADSIARMKDPNQLPTIRLYQGAVRVAFHDRIRQPIELTSLQIGDVHIVNLPGEPLIDFQFYAQGLKPAGFVAVAGYGDCSTGYICPEKAFTEGGYEPTDANVKRESEAAVKKAIATLLGVE